MFEVYGPIDEPAYGPLYVAAGVCATCDAYVWRDAHSGRLRYSCDPDCSQFYLTAIQWVPVDVAAPRHVWN